MDLKTNVLYYGDNLKILREYIPDESVDLIYLDPPFNSKRDYNVIFKEDGDEESEAQIEAFTDTWKWGIETEKTHQDIMQNLSVNIAQTIDSFIQFLGRNDVTAYLVMMTPRLVELQRALKKTGSIYIHCDPTTSHYIKVLCDQIFGKEKFKNEIIWCYDTGGRPKNYFPRKHDTILWYTKNRKYNFYYDQVALKRDTSTMHEPILYDEKGKPYQRNIKYGKEYRYYLDKGVLPNDWWTDIPALNPAAKERLGYPTQKPVALLERIINASSTKGEFVMDPFCGCGTTLIAAQKLGRKWIGIDITHLAVGLMRKRLKDMFPGIKIDVVGEPEDRAGAQELAKQDRFQFQWWAVDLVGARPISDRKKGADRGIDGIILFDDDSLQKVIIQVKSGKIGSPSVRDLKGVLERERAAIGVIVTLNKPTSEMQKEAASTGFYHSKHWDKNFPKLQILTVEALLQGKKIDMPPFKPQYKLSQQESLESETLSMDF